MTAVPVTRRPDHAAMREVLGYVLDTADRLGIDLYGVRSHNRGTNVDAWVAARDDRAAVDRLAAALGVTVDPLVEDTGKVYSVRSRGQWYPWERETGPYPYGGPTVAIGDHLVEVAVLCSLTSDEDDQ